MSRTLFAFLAGMAAITAPLLSAQKNTTVNVTTTVNDYNGSTQLLTSSDDYNGSGFATYSFARNSVTSEIDSNGNWALYVANPRYLWLSPNQPIGSQQASTVPIPTAGYYGGQAHGICSIAFTSLGMGIAYSCQLGVEFDYGGLTYKLAMGPALPWGGPATGVASVVCNQVKNNQCADWTMTSAPDANGQNANVANLYYYVGKTATWVYLGQYSNSFLIHVTNP